MQIYIPPLETIISIDPVTIGLALSAGWGAYQSWKNTQEQKNAEQRQKEWLEQDYRNRRADALYDTEKANQYNSPLQQMQRLREAGLNPNLVYGKGAENTMAVTRDTQTKQFTPIAPRLDFDPSNSITQFADIKAKQAQTSNIEQNTLTQQSVEALNRIKTISEATKNETSQYMLGRARKLEDGILKEQELRNIKLAAETNSIDTKTGIALDENQRRELLTTASLSKTLQQIVESRINVELKKTQTNETKARIDNLKQTLENLKDDSAVKQYDADLRRMGIDRDSPWYIKTLMSWLNNNKPEGYQTQQNPTQQGTIPSLAK